MAMGAIGGAALETCATKVLTGQRIRHAAENEKEIISQQGQKTFNELDELFYSRQKQVVHEVEGRYLKKGLRIDSLIAAGLSLAEYLASLWIVIQMALPGGLVVGSIVAAIPVIIVWGVAAYLSEADAMPEHYTKLIQTYEHRYLQPPVDLEGAELEEWLVEKEAYEAKLDYLIHFLAEGDPSGRINNLHEAGLSYELEALKKSRDKLFLERHHTIEELRFQSKKACADLNNCFPFTEIDVSGKTPQQIELEKQRIAKEKIRWVEEQEVIVNQDFKERIEMAMQKYATLIQQHDRKIKDLTDQLWGNDLNLA